MNKVREKNAYQSEYWVAQYNELHNKYIIIAMLIILVYAINISIDLTYATTDRPLTNPIRVKIFSIFVYIALIFKLTITDNHISAWRIIEFGTIYALLNGLLIWWLADGYNNFGPTAYIANIFIAGTLVKLEWRRQVTIIISYAVFGMIIWHIKIIDREFYNRLLVWALFSTGASMVAARSINKFEEALFEKNKKLEQSLQLATELRIQNIDLVSLLTHELKNPLASINLKAELIRKTSKEPNVIKQSIKIIDITLSSGKLISEWVKISQNNQNTTDGVQSPSKILEEIIYNFQEENPSLRIESDGNKIPAVLIDEKSLSLVFNNVLTNIRMHSKSKRISLRCRTSDTSALIRIRDYGVGIPKQMHQKIFLRGVTLNDKGTGTGLYMARAIIEQFGGSITVHSRKDYGTAFNIRLPRAHFFTTNST